MDDCSLVSPVHLELLLIVALVLLRRARLNREYDCKYSGIQIFNTS